MKICLVTTFPPSRGGLSEYGFHIASELQRNSFLSLTVLADTVGGKEPEPDGFSVDRCWSFNDVNSPARLLSAIRRHEPDVVWFNLLFTTFGHNPFVAFCGLATPLLTRLSGLYTHVTLHHLMDAIDLKDAGVRFPRLYRAAGGFATRMLLMSNSVTVLMPAYRKILFEHYGERNVHVRPHGILSFLPEYPDFSRRGNPTHRLLAFGKWGTYKRLEPMIEAFDLIAKSLPNVKLVVAGGVHAEGVLGGWKLLTIAPNEFRARNERVIDRSPQWLPAEGCIHSEQVGDEIVLKLRREQQAGVVVTARVGASDVEVGGFGDVLIAAQMGNGAYIFATNTFKDVG